MSATSAILTLMMDALWGVFPRLMEENINGLLDSAQPNALKALQIFRALKARGYTSGNVQKFSRDLEDYFSKPKLERRKSTFDAFLDRPMDHETYSLFQLDFRSSVVSDSALRDVASWAHNVIRVAKKINRPFMSLEILTRTFHRITNPTRNEKAQGITFKDFCAIWKATVTKQLAYREDPLFDELLEELDWLNEKLKRKEAGTLEALEPASLPLSQLVVNWAVAVKFAATERRETPLPPPELNFQNKRIQELLRVIQLYSISLSSSRPEIIENKERIRLTLIDRCDLLLGYSIRLAS